MQLRSICASQRYWLRSSPGRIASGACSENSHFTAFSGTPLARNDEGDLAWHPLAALERLPMWEGDRYFLPLVFDHDPRLFHGFMPYAEGRPVGWSYSRL